MMELEEMVKKEVYTGNFTIEELKYIELAKIMPYDYIIGKIEEYKSNWYKIDEVQFMKELENLFKVSKYELSMRIKNVHKIRKYRNKKLNKLVNEQKEMIKSLKR